MAVLELNRGYHQLIIIVARWEINPGFFQIIVGKPTEIKLVPELVVCHLKIPVRPVGKTDKERIDFAILDVPFHLALKSRYAIRIVFEGQCFEFR